MADGRIEIDTRINSDGADQGIQELSDRMHKFGSSLKDAGDGLSKYVSLPLVATGVAAFKFSNDFNAAMANVATLIPDNAKRINELKSNVQDMSVQFGKSTADIADGLYQVVSTFGDTSDTSKILADNVKAAGAGMATTTDAINLTAAVSKGYNDTSETMIKHITDLAFQTANLGITTFPELSQSIRGVVPLASTLGVKMEDMFAVFATGSGVTGDTSQVATQFQNVLQSLMAPTTAMSALMKKLGYANGEAMLKSLGLQGTINKVVDTAKKANVPLQDYIGSIDGQTLALALNGNLSKGFTDNLKAMGNVAGSTDKAFKQQTQGVNKLGFEWEQLKQKSAVLLQKLGDALAPAFMKVLKAMEPLTQGIQNLAKWFSNLSKGNQEMIIGFLGILAALGPLLMAIGTVAITIASLGALAGPVGLVLLVIVGLAAAAIAIITHWGPIKAFFINLWNEIVQATTNAWNSISNFFVGLWNSIVSTTQAAWNGIVSFFSGVWKSVQDAFNTGINAIVNFSIGLWQSFVGMLTSVFSAIGGFFVAFWNKLKDDFMVVIGAIVAVAMNLWNNFGGGIMQIFNGFVSYFTGIWNLIKNIFLGSILLIIDIFTGNWKMLQSDAIGIWNNILAAFGQIWSGIVGILSGILNIIITDLTNAWNFIRSIAITVWGMIVAEVTAIWNSLVSGAIAIFNFIKDAVVSAWYALVYNVTTIVTNMKNTIINAWNALPGLIMGAINYIKNAVVSGFNSVVSFVSSSANNIKNTASSAFSNMVNSIGGFVSSIPSKISDAFDRAISFLKGINLEDIGKSIIQGLINGIGGAVGGVIQKAKDLASSVSNTLRGALQINSPSKVVAKIGVGVPEGLAKGINDSSHLVTQATNNMANKAIPLNMPFTTANNSSSKSAATAAKGVNVNVYPQQANLDGNDLMRIFNRQVALYGL